MKEQQSINSGTFIEAVKKHADKNSKENGQVGKVDEEGLEKDPNSLEKENSGLEREKAKAIESFADTIIKDLIEFSKKKGLVPVNKIRKEGSNELVYSSAKKHIKDAFPELLSELRKKERGSFNAEILGNRISSRVWMSEENYQSLADILEKRSSEIFDSAEKSDSEERLKKIREQLAA